MLPTKLANLGKTERKEIIQQTELLIKQIKKLQEEKSNLANQLHQTSFILSEKERQLFKLQKDYWN